MMEHPKNDLTIIRNIAYNTCEGGAHNGTERNQKKPEYVSE